MIPSVVTPSGETPRVLTPSREIPSVVTPSVLILKNPPNVSSTARCQEQRNAEGERRVEITG
ncbi:MAG: hypothetical protein O3B70_07045 [Bacteroidetes bacterium]|nr:hypothetical protein [Bacteroidota bacterium]MDA0904077.1 hypothetical protein [Bacteroidota bacterium]MDA1243198.1 hypothetical protein [Bacteroidota bacterium]